MKAYVIPPDLTTLFNRVSTFDSKKPSITWPDGYSTTSLDLETVDTKTSSEYKLLDQSLEPPYTKISLEYPINPTDDLMSSICRFYVQGGQQHEFALPQTLMEWVPSPVNVWTCDGDLEIILTGGTEPKNGESLVNYKLVGDNFDKFFNGQDPYPQLQGTVKLGVSQLSSLPLNARGLDCTAIEYLTDSLVRSDGLGYPGGLIKSGSSFSGNIDLVWASLRVGRNSTTKSNLINLDTGTTLFSAPSTILHAFKYLKKIWVVTNTGIFAATGESNTLATKTITSVGTFDGTFVIIENNRNISIWEEGTFRVVGQVPAGRTSVSVAAVGGSAYLMSYAGVVMFVTDLVSGLDIASITFTGSLGAVQTYGYTQLGFYLEFSNRFFTLYKTRSGISVGTLGGNLGGTAQTGKLTSGGSNTGIVLNVVQPFYRIDSLLLKNTLQFTRFSTNTTLPSPLIKEIGTTNSIPVPSGVVLTDLFNIGVVLRGDGWYLVYQNQGVYKLVFLGNTTIFSKTANNFEIVLNLVPTSTVAFSKNSGAVYAKKDAQINSATDRRVYPTVGNTGQKCDTTCLTYSSWDVPIFVNAGTAQNRVLPESIGTYPMTSIDSMDRLTTPESDSLGFEVWTQDDGDNPNELWTTGAIPSPVLTFRTLGRADSWSFMPSVAANNVLATVFRGYTQIFDTKDNDSAGKGLRPKITVNVVDWKEQLSENINLATGYFCPHLFGGAACGVALSQITNRILLGTITAYSSRQIQITLDTPVGVPATFKIEDYEAYKLKVLDGILSGSEFVGRGATTTAVVTGTVGVYTTGGTITVTGYFDLPYDSTKLLGSAVSLFPDCRKTYTDCTKYGNTRFLGFPYVPSASRAYTASGALPTTDQLTGQASFLP
jgi:hypothetical protein